MKYSAESLRQMKATTPIAMLTAYTTPVARCLEKAGVPVILVCDTVGMVEMGFDSTRHVTLEHMRYHIGAVRRGAPYDEISPDHLRAMSNFNVNFDGKTACGNR